jgi:hypothetical protein
VGGRRGEQQEATESEKIEVSKSARVRSVWLEGTHPRHPQVTASKKSTISARNDDFRVVAHLPKRARADAAKSSVPSPRALGPGAVLAAARVRRGWEGSPLELLSTGRSDGSLRVRPVSKEEARWVERARTWQPRVDREGAAQPARTPRRPGARLRALAEAARRAHGRRRAFRKKREKSRFRQLVAHHAGGRAPRLRARPSRTRCGRRNRTSRRCRRPTAAQREEPESRDFAISCKCETARTCQQMGRSERGKALDPSRGWY